MSDRGSLLQAYHPISTERMQRSVSTNWKALAPLIKNAKKGDKIPCTNSTPNEPPATGGELWFDVDEQSLRRSEVEIKKAFAGQDIPIKDLFPKPPTTSHHVKDAGKYVGMDCEMVGVGPDGIESALARVSLVNYHGEVLLDTFVRPVGRITDYRTAVSGVEPHHLVGAPSLVEAQERVWSMLKGKVLVGHSLKNDFKVLLLEHPRKLTRDTAKYRPFRRIARGKSPSLKRLAKEILGVTIQSGSHDSVDDARVAMLLYRSQKDEWENYLFRGEGKKFKAAKRARKAQNIEPSDHK